MEKNWGDTPSATLKVHKKYISIKTDSVLMLWSAFYTMIKHD